MRNISFEPIIVGPFKVISSNYHSFAEIVKSGVFYSGFNNGYNLHLVENAPCHQAFTATSAVLKEKELYLYWGGRSQMVKDRGIAEYLRAQNLQVVKGQGNSSIFINAMKILNEDRLTEEGVPPFVNIVMATDAGGYLPGPNWESSFISCYRNGHRLLSLTPALGPFSNLYGFLAEKAA